MATTDTVLINLNRVSKYLLIISVAVVLWLLGRVDETVLGLTPSALNGFAPPIFIFSLIVLPIVFILGQYLPFLCLIAASIVWWAAGRKWVWSRSLASLILAGAASTFSLWTNIGNPVQFAIAAILVVFFASRIKGRRVPGWIDGFGKFEVVFLTILVIWLLPSGDWGKTDQETQSLQAQTHVPPYTTWFERDMTEAAKVAALRFPNPDSCFTAQAKDVQSPEQFKIDWAQINYTAEAEVCIFRALSALDGINASRSFFEAQGLSMSSENFSPEKPYVEKRDDALRVTAYWSIREKGPKFPTKGILARLRAAVPYSMNVNVYYSNDGNSVLAVRIGYNTL